MHLGAAMGTPTVGIFGPESSRRWAPAGPHAITVRAEGVACSPCANTYRLLDPPDCINSDRLQCLRQVSVEMVFEALRELTGEAGEEMLHVT
jgi:heptosyltransferase-2